MANPVSQVYTRYQASDSNGLTYEALKPAAEGGDQDDNSQGQVQTHRRPPRDLDVARCRIRRFACRCDFFRRKSSGVSVRSVTDGVKLEEMNEAKRRSWVA